MAPAAPARPADRVTELLDTAIRLFAARGYQAVSLDDIGAELGLAGPSLYHYYATKSDILVAAYTDLAVRERTLFAVYVWEAVNLPPAAGRRIRSRLDADVQAWCAALGDVRPALTDSQRLALVHAARAVVHDVVRIGHWHDRAALGALVTAVLNAPLERPGK